jgi:hypothetical protein
MRHGSLLMQFVPDTTPARHAVKIKDDLSSTADNYP